MTEVEIEYCVPCGFRNRALDVQEAILTSLETDLAAVRLVMGDHGIFQVRADGAVVYEKASADTEFDVDDIVRAVHDRV